MDMGNAQRKTVWYVDDTWVDQRVREYLEIPDYEFVAAEEASNDSFHEFVVEPITNEGCSPGFDMYQVVKDDLLSGGWIYRTEDVLCILCTDGHIEAGEYIVRVAW